MKTATPLYDQIGEGYDATRRADTFLASRLGALLCARSGGSYLDLACGTGNYTTALAATDGRWIGIDSSPAMIAKARLKSSRIDWHIGDVAALPVVDASIDGVMCVLAMHHFPDRLAAFREVRRILRSGGRFVAFTADRRQMRRYWLNRYFPEAMARATDQMPALETVEAALREAGLTPRLREPYSVRPDLQDFFLYCGKHAPQRYLDAQVRSGISTFAALASRDEVDGGCKQLAREIASGVIEEIIADSEHAEGDYTFVAAELT